MTDWEFRELPPGEQAAAGPAGGDGVFETIRVRDGRLTLRDAHLVRLRAGLERLQVPAVPEFHTELAARCDAAAAGLDDRVLRVTVQVAGGDRGYARRVPLLLRVGLALRPAPARPDPCAQAGVQVRTCRQRISLQPQLAGIKHLNRLDQILATGEHQNDGIDEGLMLDPDGRLVCGTRSNVFLRIGAAWMTPSLARCGVAGTMRGHLMSRLEQAGDPVTETDVEGTALNAVEEMYLTNSVIGVWPVVCMDGRRLQVGDACRRALCLARDCLRLDP